MIVFHADLDNTLIYSYRHEIGREKVSVEVYEGREISFMTSRSLSLLKRLREHVMLVPTTTRTEEQYGRIDLKTGVPDYALVCNGGVLLREGRELPEWYEESLCLTEKSQNELLHAQVCLQEDRDRIFEVRNIRSLFLFTKSGDPAATVIRLKERLDPALVQVFSNGAKVYALPEGLDKGTAVRRFQEYIKADTVFAAGDSEFDLSMLMAADHSWAPETLVKQYPLGSHVTGLSGGQVFSDMLLERVYAKICGQETGRLFSGREVM